MSPEGQTVASLPAGARRSPSREGLRHASPGSWARVAGRPVTRPSAVRPQAIQPWAVRPSLTAPWGVRPQATWLCVAGLPGTRPWSEECWAEGPWETREGVEGGHRPIRGRDELRFP